MLRLAPPRPLSRRGQTLRDPQSPPPNKRTHRASRRRLPQDRVERAFPYKGQSMSELLAGLIGCGVGVILTVSALLWVDRGVGPRF